MLRHAYVDGERELAELAALVSWAFGFPVARALQWLQKTGAEHVRVAREAGRVVAGLVEIPMAQWYGGQSVSLLGIAGVVVAPDARGRGVARELMSQTLREARDRGLVLSALYPASHTLYRGVGYELAGNYLRFSMRVADCPRASSTLSVEPLRAEHLLDIEAVYREGSRFRNGFLDRSSYVWERVRAPHGEKALGVVVRGSSGIEGYAFLSQKTTATGHDLVVSDLGAVHAEAHARLFTFFAGHRSTAGNLIWRGSGADASLFGFPERTYEQVVEQIWMLRVLDAPAALLARGYPPIDATVDFVLVDDLLPENAGSYRLTLSGGRAKLERGGGVGGLQLGPRGLAALYSGFVSPGELARAGLLRGDEAALATAAAVFAGPTPAMVDFF